MTTQRPTPASLIPAVILRDFQTTLRTAIGHGLPNAQAQEILATLIEPTSEAGAFVHECHQIRALARKYGPPASRGGE